MEYDKKIQLLDQTIDEMVEEIEQNLIEHGYLVEGVELCDWCDEPKATLIEYVDNHFKGNYCKSCCYLAAGASYSIDRDDS